MSDQDPLAQAQEQEQKRQQMEERKQMMLTSLLTPEAKQRLARIAMVKPEKADEVTDMILSMAQRGAITEKVSETRLKQMIENVNETTQKGPKITFARKKAADSDEDEEYDL